MDIKEFRSQRNDLIITINDYHEWMYFWLKGVIKRKFKLKKISKTYVDVFGDLKFQDFKNKDGAIGIEWSIWEGFHIIALDEDSENLVYSIKNFLEEKYNKPHV